MLYCVKYPGSEIKVRNVSYLVVELRLLLRFNTVIDRMHFLFVVKEKEWHRDGRKMTEIY
jgi:hypothetical protein